MTNMEMDRGVLFSKGFEVKPCADGSFVVRAVGPDYQMPVMWAFTNIGDLMRFLTEESHATVLSKANEKQPSPTEIKPTPTIAGIKGDMRPAYSEATIAITRERF